jgi:hypothetical protein
MGALAVIVAEGFTPASADLFRVGRTMVAVMIDILGIRLANRSRAPAAIHAVPRDPGAPPAPATPLPLVAETKTTRESLQGQALETGVPPASGWRPGSNRRRALPATPGALP